MPLKLKAMTPTALLPQKNGNIPPPKTEDLG